MHTHFRRIRASENRTIRNKRHLHPETRRRNRSAGSGHACTANDEIGGNDFIGNAGGGPTRPLWRMLAVSRQKHGVATSVKTRKVAKSQFMGASLQIDGSGFLPYPCAVAFGSQLISKRFSINGKRDRLLHALNRAVHADHVDITDGLCLIAVVGRGMVKAKGTAARVFNAVSDAGINIRMINQGSSEHNIILSVDEESYEQAMKAIFEEFVK
jgi:hypothetical protein